MAGTTKFPTALDDSSTLYQPGSGDLVASVDHAALHDNVDVAVIATQTKLGIGASTPTANKVLRATGTGTTAYAQVALTTDVTGTLPVANGGTGVTSSTGTGNTVLSTSPTLTTPVFSSITNTGTLTLPTTSDTLVGRATTDTLTNKTISGAGNTITNIGPSSLATGAAVAFVATAEGTASTTYTDLATTTDTLTVTIGSNGIAWIAIDSVISGTIGGAVGYVSVQISGATTLAASDANALGFGAVSGLTAAPSGWGRLFTGLAVGSTTFKLKYRTTTGTVTCTNRYLTVIPL